MEQQWQTIGTFWKVWKRHPPDPHLRMLLSSDGTSVRTFNSLFLSPTELEIVDQYEDIVDQDLSLVLEVPKGEKVLKRSVWLKVSEDGTIKKRVLYAVSSFPVLRFSPNLYQALQLGLKPLGQIIEENRLSTYRDRLEIAFLPFPEVAMGLALQKDTLFWARRYRLFISGQISAVICEVFSPQLSSLSF